MIKDVETVMDEYFQAEHAELVPEADTERPMHHVFYLPMHMVRRNRATPLRCG